MMNNSISFLKNISSNSKMTKEEAIKRHKELNKIARKAQDAYYNNQPIMLDKEYDAIYDEIEKLEKDFNIKDKNSVTQTAGIAEKVEKGKEVKHEFKCLSQAKTKDRQELLKWLGNYEAVISLKEDGSTIVATYDSGKLNFVATRGNGETGKLVTDFANTQNCIPKTIKDKGHVVVRGEYLFTYSEYDRLINAGENYTHPRNAATGNVNQLNMTLAKQRQGEFHVFELAKCSNYDKLKTYEEQLKWCKNQGFTIVENKKVDKNNLLTEVQNFEDKLDKLDHPTDGLVLRINDNSICEKLGYTGHNPRFGIAFKWSDDTYQTTLRDIEWNASRTGKIVPTAIFDEVDLDGALTTRATLNNISYIKDKKLGIGDTIEIFRANKVIPQVLKSIQQSGKFSIPDKCPSCGHKTEVRKDGISEILYCNNPDCPAKQSKSLERFASKACMNIEGLSTKTIEDFIEAGYLKTFIDFYRLDRFKDEIIKRPGYGKTSYDNMIKSIEKSKEVDLYRLISAFGINNVSDRTAKDICKHFNNDFNIIRNADEDDFMNINGIGMAAAAPLVQYFQNNKDEIDELLTYIKIKKDAPVKTSSSKLSGKTFMITGSLEHFKNRKDLEKMIEENGGKVGGSVNKDTSYLINNDITSTSSKNQKAKQLGIPIISEQDFLNMIK